MRSSIKLTHETWGWFIWRRTCVLVVNHFSHRGQRGMTWRETGCDVSLLNVELELDFDGHMPFSVRLNHWQAVDSPPPWRHSMASMAASEYLLHLILTISLLFPHNLN